MFWSVGVAAGIRVVNVVITDGIKRAVIGTRPSEVPETFIYIAVIAYIWLAKVFAL